MFFKNWFYLYTKPTRAETRFERLICRLGEPYRAQYPFPSLRRIADFVLLDSRVVIEIDGLSHSRPAQAYRDCASTIALENKGWKVIRFSNAEAETLTDSILADEIQVRIKHRPTLQALEAALAELPVPVAKPRARKPKPGRAKGRKRQA